MAGAHLKEEKSLCSFTFRFLLLSPVGKRIIALRLPSLVGQGGSGPMQVLVLDNHWQAERIRHEDLELFGCTMCLKTIPKGYTLGLLC